MPVVIGMIGGGKVRVEAKLAGQQTGGQRHASENPDPVLTSSRKKRIRGLEPKQIKDYLDALHIGVGERLQRLFHSLDAYSIETDFALLRQLVQNAKNLWHIIDL